MRRDMELVRKILIDISVGKVKQELSKNLEEDIKYSYHLQILKQAELVEYQQKEYMDGTFFVDEPTLTWLGNDYLDSIENEGVWSKVKEVIKEKELEISKVPFDILIELAKQQFKQWIGME